MTRPTDPIDLTPIAEIARRFAAPLREALLRTPLEEWHFNGSTFRVKREDLQETGSFKVRGALVRLAAMDWSILRFGVVTASHGNHGLGVAWAAGRLGTMATIVVPSDTPEVKRAGIRALGAELIVTPAPGYDAAETLARRLARERHATFVSAFDDPYVQAGNGGTTALEILDEAPHTHRIVVPVGGGGLMTGVIAAIRSTWPLIELIGVQTEACPSMWESLRDGKALLVREGAPSVAEALEGGVAASTFDAFRGHQIPVVVVRELAVRQAMARAYQNHGVTLEGAAAVGLAAIDTGLVASDPDTVVLLTGSNVDSQTLTDVLAESVT